MFRSIRRVMHLVVVWSLVGSAAWAAKGDGPPTGQKELLTWWRAAQKLWIGEDAYEAEGTHFEDGVCKANFDDGIIIPVYSGEPPLSERVVGVLFIGNGSLEVGFTQTGEAWSFANHMVLNKERGADEMRPIADSKAPYSVPITRAMILSADPAIEAMLLEKMPVGAGVYRTASEDGVDEEYVVTESRGKFRAQMISTNMLPQRTLRLEEAGLDPRAMIRQDRLLHEELGFPGRDLRVIADFRTADRFHVAAIDGVGIGPSDYDQWLTCFRDGLGQSDVGGRSVVFTHGEDLEGRRRFMRVSGERFPQTPNEIVGRPRVMMVPVRADTNIEMRPVQRRNYQRITVDSLLTVRAQGAALQHVALRLPTERASRESYDLLKLETEDGRPMAWVGLHADEAFFMAKGDAASDSDETSQIDEGADALDATSGQPPSLDVAGAGGGEADEISGLANETGADGTTGSGGVAPEQIGGSIEMQTRQQVFQETNMHRDTAFRYEVLALLPEPIPEGEETTIRVKWTTKWRYSNMSNAGRQLGVTTGVHPYLPELLPAPGGTAWATSTRLSIPPSGLWTSNVALSGDTVKEWTTDDGWRWIQTESPHARWSGVGIGKWDTHIEPAAEGMPSVRVHLFPSHAWGLREFPPEVRRVISFLQRFLPEYDLDEIEVYQTVSATANTAMGYGWHKKAAGMVGIRTVKPTEVGESTTADPQGETLAQRQIVRQVAHQYWGQRAGPNSTRDGWLTDALADAYSVFYARAVFGKDISEELLSTLREGIEDPIERAATKDQVNRRRRPMSLTGNTVLSDMPGHVMNNYGLFILAQSLRTRVGDQAYFMALDRLSRRRDQGFVTTDDLQAVMEETSSVDLTDFFDFWIHAGRVPDVGIEIREEATEEGTTLHGCITSGLPFGRFDLPVRITDNDGERITEALVDVDNGYGTFEVPGRDADSFVEIDPNGQLVLYGRKVKALRNPDKPTSCEKR
jgi:hypothetical protein